MKEKLRVILKISSFALVFFILVNVFSLVFMPKTGNRNVTGMVKYVTYGYRSEPKNSLDVVLVGNSDLYRAFSPIEMWQQNGVTSYTCGGPLQTPEMSYSILKEAFLLHNPKLVVVEVDQFFTTSNPVHGKSDKKNKKKPTPFQKTVKYFATFDKNIGTKLTYKYPLIKYHSRWDELGINDFIDLKDSWHFVGKGYLLNKEIAGYDNTFDYMAKSDQFEEMRSGVEKTLGKIRAICKKNDAEVMFVVMPSATSWNYEKHNTVQKYSDENNIRFLDLNTMLDEINFDWKSDTKDKGNHLNLFGGTKTTKKIGEFISENYSFEKRRDEELIARWENDSKIYFDTKEELLSKN